jgi:hypothetical protein
MLARSPAAIKKRAYRRRLRDGLIVLKLESREAALGASTYSHSRPGFSEARTAELVGMLKLPDGGEHLAARRT